jgi:PAS domain S-box-containing protein
MLLHMIAKGVATMTARDTRKRISTALLFVTGLLAVLLGYYFHVARANEQAMRRALQQAESWKSLVDDMQMAIVVCDEQGIITQWSTGAERLLGHKAEDVVGAELSLLIPPDRYKYHARGFKDPARRKRLADGEILQVDGYALRADGEIIPVHLWLSAVTNGCVRYVAQVAREDNMAKLPPTPRPPTMQVEPPSIKSFRPKSSQKL